MKRKSIFLFVIAIAFLSTFNVTAQKKSKGNNRMSQNQNPQQIVESMFAAFNRHDVEAMAALYSDDAFIDSPDFDAPKRGQQAIREIYTKYFRQTPDIRDDVKSIVACGDKVFVEFVSSGTIENPPSYAPPQMKGKKFAVKMVSVLEIKNGKIVRDVIYYNQLSFLKQIGAM